MPSAAPTNIRVVYTDWLSIMVEWDLVPTSSANGIILFYMVKYGEPGSNRSSLISRDFSAVLSVQADTLYAIQVAAATRNGVGRFSESITARTKKYKFY